MIQTKSIRKRLDNVVKALNVDKDMFYWAFCSVFTRSFAGDQKADSTIPEWFKQPEGSTDFPLNAPLVDLANHGTNMKLLCWSGLNKKNGSMYLRTHKPIKKGTELCISYGLGKSKIQNDLLKNFCLQIRLMMIFLHVTDSVTGQVSTENQK